MAKRDKKGGNPLTKLIILLAFVGAAVLLFLHYFPQGRETAREIVRGGKSITVVLRGEGEISPKAKVTFKKVLIGEVEKITLDSKNRQVLVVTIMSDYSDHLRASSIFYIKDKKELVHEVLEENDDPKDGDPVFPGFSSYSRLLVFKAKIAGAEVVKTTKEMIDELMN